MSKDLNFENNKVIKYILFLDRWNEDTITSTLYKINPPSLCLYVCPPTVQLQILPKSNK